MTSDNASDEVQHKGAIDEKLTLSVYAADVDTHDIDEKKLLRKLDWALIPW